MALFERKSYSGLLALPTYAERLEYLQLVDAHRFAQTFGDARHLNQALYASHAWRHARREAIIRDNGCDLGIDGLSIAHGIIVHHINPITLDDVLNERDALLDPENLICCTKETHHAIHYGHDTRRPDLPTERRPFDTCPWR